MITLFNKKSKNHFEKNKKSVTIIIVQSREEYYEKTKKPTIHIGANNI